MSEESDEMEVRQKTEVQSGEGTRQGAYFQPPVDIWESDETITLRADVPGCDPEDFEINLNENRLTITAATSPIEENWEPVYGEYREGHFLREFRLGKEIDRSGISAQLTNGVLEVTLPKVESEEPRKIEIET